MTATQTCPSCGETEALRGQPSGGEIEVTCLGCGMHWMRGGARCKTCGDSDVVSRPQSMSRHPRGNQLSIVGWREILLCRRCDHRALAESLTKNLPVSEGYVSACLFGDEDARPEPSGQRGQPPPRGTATTRPTRLPGHGSAQDVASTQEAGSTHAVDEGRGRGRVGPVVAASSTGSARQAAPARPETALADPTVRQAVEAYLKTDAHADSTAILMLGTHLGSSTRLKALEQPQTATDLREWFLRLWGERSGGRGEEARETVLRAIDHWRAQGWLSGDPAAELR